MTRVAVLFVLAALSGPAAGQQPGKLPYGGSEVFRFALFQHGLKPISQPTDALQDPHDTIIVITGDIARLPMELRLWVLPNFLSAGGSILVATDGPAPAPGLNLDWPERMGIQIVPSAVTADAAHCYQGVAGRPFVRPLQQVNFGAPSPFDLFKGVAEAGDAAVATDRPSQMSFNPVQPRRYLVKPLARYPAEARQMSNNAAIPANQAFFAVSFQPQEMAGDPNGRMVVIADHGVFVNGMMGVVKDPAAKDGYRFDNGNWAFTNRTIEWLQGGRQKRTRCLFIEDGSVKDQFARELKDLPPKMPNIPPEVIANILLNHANEIIDEKQQKDAMNQFLEGWLGMPRLLRIFLDVVTVLFALAALRWMRRALRKPEPAASMTPYTHATLQPRGGVLKQRTMAQIEVQNLYEAARRRVRERFDVLGGRPGSSGQMPPVLTANDLRDGPLLYQSVRWLWHLGYGDTPLAIPPGDWDRTNVLLERVTARAARGDWSFGQDV